MLRVTKLMHVYMDIRNWDFCNVTQTLTNVFHSKLYVASHFPSWCGVPSCFYMFFKEVNEGAVANANEAEKNIYSRLFWGEPSVPKSHADASYLEQYFYGMNPSFELIDPLNPFHMMSFWDAQVHQLLGTRVSILKNFGENFGLPSVVICRTWRVDKKQLGFNQDYVCITNDKRQYYKQYCTCVSKKIWSLYMEEQAQV